MANFLKKLLCILKIYSHRVLEIMLEIKLKVLFVLISTASMLPVAFVVMGCYNEMHAFLAVCDTFLNSLHFWLFRCVFLYSLTMATVNGFRG
jgi:hypothetical protein